jgi:hypothetical protein
MKIAISQDAENDLADGYWFYERQNRGLGNYFRSCLIADVESLQYFAGIYEIEHGYHRALSKRFPFRIYYSICEWWPDNVQATLTLPPYLPQCVRKISHESEPIRINAPYASQRTR